MNKEFIATTNVVFACVIFILTYMYVTKPQVCNSTPLSVLEDLKNE